MKLSKRFYFLFYPTLILVAGWWAYLQFQQAHDAYANFLFNLVYALPLVIAGILFFLAGKQMKRSAVSAHRLYFGINLLFYATALIFWFYYNTVLHVEVPSPSLADALFIGSSLLMVFSYLILLFSGKMGSSSFSKPSVAVIISLVSLAPLLLLLGWVEAFEDPYITFSTFYTISSLILIFLILMAIIKTKDQHELFLHLVLFVAVFVQGLGDFIYAFREDAEVYWNGDISDGLFATSAIVFLLAAGYASRMRNGRGGLSGKFLKPHIIIPATIVLAGIIVSAHLADIFHQNRAEAVASRMQSDIDAVVSDITYGLDVKILRLQATRAFFENSVEVTKDEFDGFVSTASTGVSSGGIAYANRNHIVELATGESLIGRNYGADPVRAPLILQAARTRELVISEPLVLFGGNPGIILVQPLFRDGEFIGSIIGARNFEDLMVHEASLDRNFSAGFLTTPNRIYSHDSKAVYDRIGRRVLDSDGNVTEETEFDTTLLHEEDLTKELTVGGQTWLYFSKPHPSLKRTTRAETLGVFSLILFFFVGVSFIVYLLASQNPRLQRELDRLTKDLRDKIAESERIQKEKTRFVSLVSHQLRAPMTQIRWTLESILEGNGRLSKTLRASIQDLHEMVIAESTLVGDLLDVSRIERGVLKLNRKKTPVKKLLAETLKPLEKTAKDHDVEIALGAIPSKLQVMVDAEKAAEALRNLVDNAVKYTRKGTTVEVDIDDKDSHIAFEIRDHGKGIPKALRERLFDIKSDKDPKSQSDTGAGLGLYLTKEFIEAMDGTISFTTSGKGTIFTVTLPKA